MGEESEKDFTFAMFLSLFFGWTGLDRIYLGRYFTGILKGISLGGLGMWWILDIFLLLSGELKDGKEKSDSPFIGL